MDPKLRQVFADVLSEPVAARLTPQSAAGEVPGWDSQNFVAIVIGMEAAFNLRFSTLEAARMGTIEGIEQVLRERGVKLDA